jgi:EamA domain-containing membrane protein RarD
MTWKTILKRAVVVAVAGVAIYLVLPDLVSVLWLPLLAGLPAYLLFRRRYKRPDRAGSPGP